VLLHLKERNPDPLFIEETVVGMLLSILRHSDGCAHWFSSRKPTPQQQRLVEQARMLLTLQTERRVPLAVLASHLGCSAFHLCHSFRLVEGMTMHEYRMQLRLRTAVERLLGCRSTNLSHLAIELGFSSHSHFSAVFRRTFGTKPSRFVEETRRVR
jgi:AraC-like DNA-binding protein